MKWVELSVITKDVCVEAVSDLFYDLGCGGVVIEDPETARRCIARGEWDLYELPSGFLEREYVVVTAYFPEPGPDQAELRSALDKIKERLGEEYRLVVGCVDENDWANLWKDYYHTLRVGERLVIKPSWEDYSPLPGEVVIEIDPEMAFGTGTHATTRFCLQLMEKHLRPGMWVWDVGTGSGILSLAAALMGAGQVVAIDNDPVAVRTAQRNVERCGLTDKIEVRQLDFLTATPSDEVDMVVANILAEVIDRMADKVHLLLKDDGLFIMSGIIVSKWPELSERIQEKFDIIEIIEDESWVAAVVRKRRE